MNGLYYVGFDIHKKSVSYCVKTAAGELVDHGKVAAWADGLPGPWAGALEAFAGVLGPTLHDMVFSFHGGSPLD